MYKLNDMLIKFYLHCYAHTAYVINIIQKDNSKNAISSKSQQ